MPWLTIASYVVVFVAGVWCGLNRTQVKAEIAATVPDAVPGVSVTGATGPKA